jgi:LacI family transcriptional regulator
MVTGMANGRRRGTYVTASDVAAEVGVSAATVSLVVNGRAAGRVSLVTQRKVHEAVARLGYRVDAFARGLATGRRGAIALVTPDIADPFFSQVAMGVARGLRGRYQLILVATGDPAAVAPPVIDDLAGMRVDGVLVESTAAVLLDGGRSPWPIVLLDAPGHDGSDARVDFDVATGVAELVDHLWSLGHRSIGYLDWIAESPTFRVRRAALAKSWSKRGGELHSGRSRIEIEDAANVFKRIAPAWIGSVTAVVCATDLQAYGVLRSAHELGIDVPAQLSVAGFNNLEFSDVTDPPLTSVSLPAVELGTQAADMLCSLIEGHGIDSRMLRTHLVVRDSTARPINLSNLSLGGASSGTGVGG